MKYEQFILFHVHLRRGLDINRRLRFVYDRRDVKHFTALSRVYEPALPDFMNGISISYKQFYKQFINNSKQIGSRLVWIYPGFVWIYLVHQV